MLERAGNHQFSFVETEVTLSNWAGGVALGEDGSRKSSFAATGALVGDVNGGLDSRKK